MELLSLLGRGCKIFNLLGLTLKAWRCWGILERQTNHQQKAKLEKKMYTTLFVSPKIAKPMLAAVMA